MSQVSPIKVLVVDDEPTYRDLLGETLEADGFAVDVAAGGGEAIEKIIRQDFDVVITDLVMPHIDGLEVLRAAKRKKASTMVIVITGYASLETALAAIKEGVYDYITKPFQLDEIRLTLKNAAEKYALARANEELLAQLDQLRRHVEELMASRLRHGEKIEEIDRQLGDQRHEITEGLRRLRGLAPIKPTSADENEQSPYEMLMNAIRLRREEAISDSEFQALKDKILKK
jgi:two-component system response regulator PilR (NtrC family)